MVSPDDLIIYLDEKMNEAAYQPSRLAGSSIHIARLQSGQGNFLADIFHRHSGEKKAYLRKQLSTYLENPQNFEVFVVSSGQDIPIAMLVLRNDTTPILEVPLIRISDSPLSPALAGHLIFWCISRAVKMKKEVIYVTEQNISKDINEALSSNSFSKIDDKWLKVNITGVFRSDEVISVLQSVASKFIQLDSIVQSFCSDLVHAMEQNNLAQLISIEKHLWPLKISDSNILTYIVPISPVWAIDLFDAELARETLFGSNPDLALRIDNVYYRSAHTKIPTENSRILWYVSKGKNQSQGVMAVRACSYVDRRVIAPPKELFKQFSKLGVYRWQNVLQTVGNDINKELLAFRFSNTELFENPVRLATLKSVLSIGSAPQSPMSISNNIFNEIYRLGSRNYQDKDHDK